MPILQSKTLVEAKHQEDKGQFCESSMKHKDKQHALSNVGLKKYGRNIMADLEACRDLKQQHEQRKIRDNTDVFGSPLLTIQ